MTYLSDETSVLIDVVKKFEQLGIEYMLTGSMAMNYYVMPRMTRDLDIVLEFDVTGVSSLVELFSVDYYVSDEEIRYSLKYHSMFNLIHQEKVIKIDCILKGKDDYSKVAFNRRKKIFVHRYNVNIISIEDLILAKINWSKESQSQIQLDDIQSLLTYREIDFNLLEKIAIEQNLFSHLKKFLK